MKPNKLFLAVLCLILNFNYLIADEPALKINLNPPEENTKDTQSKFFSNNIF